MSDTTEQGLVERLIGRVDALVNNVAELTKAFRRHRLIVRALIGSVAFDLALSAILLFVVDRSNDTQRDLEAAQRRTDALIEQLATVEETARLTCEEGNRDDANERQFWEGLIALPSDRPPDPDGLARFRALLADTYSPEDCG